MGTPYGPGFQWSAYMEHENATRLVIPMAESFEFFDNIDDILGVEGIDVINFGPADYSISRRISATGELPTFRP